MGPQSPTYCRCFRLPFLSFATVFLVHSDCRESPAIAQNVSYHYTIPEKADDGWQTGHLSAENIDSNLVKDLFDRIVNSSYKNIHSVLIVRNGKLIVEEYFPGLGADSLYHSYKRDTLHYQASVTKSVNSLLMGIAIDQKLIRSADEKIAAFFPEYSDIFVDSAKARIRLKDCLSMYRYPNGTVQTGGGLVLRPRDMAPNSKCRKC